ncbi:MAG: glycosyltransferase [Gemmobacter sp.]|nr:glycosyltransferase [Gemmobacter sp.]
MKTILLVTDIAFWQNTIGSHMRIQGLVRHLAQHHEVCVFFFKSVPATVQADLAAIGLRNVRIVGYKEYSGRRLPFRRVMSQMEFFRDRAPEDFVSSLMGFLAENTVHAMIFEYVRMAYLLDGCPPSIPTILDMHDVMSARTISLRRAGQVASIEMSAALETALLRRFDRVLAISRADVDHLQGMIGPKPVIYAPHSVRSLPTHAVRPGFSGRLLFLGANTAPNVAGLRWFLDQVWPMLQPEGFVLDVVGNVADAFPGVPQGVVLHGQRDDLQPYLDAADIAINPVFVGGGLKIKCIDALASGLPCVTTAEGAAGLEGARGAGLVVANTRLAFLGAIRHFAASAGDRRVVAGLAPRCIAAEFGDDTAYRSLAAYLETCPAPGQTVEAAR